MHKSYPFPLRQWEGDQLRQPQGHSMPQLDEGQVPQSSSPHDADSGDIHQTLKQSSKVPSRSTHEQCWEQGSTVRPFHSHLRVNISACEREKQNRSTRASDFSTAHYTVRSHQTRRGETIPYKAAIPFAARHFCPARASAFSWISGGFAARHFCSS